MTKPISTFTYKTVEGCHIKADVYHPPEAALCPAIVWIHGGALIMGHRGSIAEWQRDTYLDAGYTVISIDYRLAPETPLRNIIEDLQDAFRWVRDNGPGLLCADPARLAAIGHSAGGYLALMAGFCVEPRPKAVVSFYGYGDITRPVQKLICLPEPLRSPCCGILCGCRPPARPACWAHMRRYWPTEGR